MKSVATPTEYFSNSRGCHLAVYTPSLKITFFWSHDCDCMQLRQLQK